MFLSTRAAGGFGIEEADEEEIDSEGFGDDFGVGADEEEEEEDGGGFGGEHRPFLHFIRFHLAAPHTLLRFKLTWHRSHAHAPIG
jgi:hypothetical protein